jgi:Family of unknown function (DUF6370)
VDQEGSVVARADDVTLTPKNIQHQLKMKKIIFAILILFNISFLAQEKKLQLKNKVVETSCGQCQFGLKDKGCDLAIRVDGKSYYTIGTTIDEHGDAHAKDGFCNAIRKAIVSGTIKNGKFLVKTFKLIKE